MTREQSPLPSPEPEDPGPARIYKFLERTGFLEHLRDNQKFREWFAGLDFDTFSGYVTRLNGIARGIGAAHRGPVKGMEQVGSMVGTDYLAPAEEDRLTLWQECFEASKDLDTRDTGLMLYYGLQAIHLFPDGNGRTGRLLFEILKSSGGSPLTEDRLDDLLRHTGETGPGRELFAEQVRSPEELHRFIQWLLAQDMLGDDFMQRYTRIYNVQAAYESVIPAEKVSEPIRSELQAYLQEQPSGGYSARNVVCLLFMKKHGLEQGNVSEKQEANGQKIIMTINSEPLLQSLDETSATELLALLKDYKRRFVRKIIDVIAHPAQEQYTFKNGETLKDRLMKPPLKAAA